MLPVDIKPAEAGGVKDLPCFVAVWQMGKTTQRQWSRVSVIWLLLSTLLIQTVFGSRQSEDQGPIAVNIAETQS